MLLLLLLLLFSRWSDVFQAILTQTATLLLVRAKTEF